MGEVMSKELEDMKEKFFVDGKEREKQTLVSLLAEVMDYCKMDKTGKIFIEVEGISIENKVKVCLAARKVGALLAENAFPAEITAEDVSVFVRTSKVIASARLGDIVNAGLASRVGRGAYTAPTLYHVDKLLRQVKNAESCRMRLRSKGDAGSDSAVDGKNEDIPQ